MPKGKALLEIDLYRYGTGEFIGTINRKADLQGWLIRSAIVNNLNGRLEFCVDRPKTVAYFPYGYRVHRNGIILKNNGEIETGKLNSRVPQDIAVMKAFGEFNPDSSLGVNIIHLDGDENNNELSNLREGLTDKEKRRLGYE